MPIIDDMNITKLLKKNHHNWKTLGINEQIFLIAEDMMDWLNLLLIK